MHRTHSEPDSRRHRSPSRAAALAFAFLLPLAATGCSALSMAWGYFDDVLAERVDAWVDLRPGQRRQLERRLEPWLQRVAIERLPGYAAFLRELAARNERGLAPADAYWAYDRVRHDYRRLLADATAWIAPPLAELEAGQIDHLERRMRSENAEYRARYLEVTRDDSRTALADRLIDQVERWIGPLDPDQVRLVRRGVTDLPDTSAEWYAYRLRMQAGLLQLVRGDADAAAIRAHLQDWWIERAGLPESEQAAFRRFERELVAVLGELAATLSQGQRAELGRRLERIAGSFETIERDARVAAGLAAD